MKAKRLVGVPAADRFESHVDRLGALASALTVKHYPELEGTRCWVWINAPANRYPSFRYGGSIVRASRFAFELHTGRKLAEGMQVCHKCDNPVCVNPLHLFEGTHKQNMEDRNAKGRQGAGTTGPRVPLSGERHRSAKLTEADVLHIRDSYSREKRNGRELAVRYGVPPQVIYRVTRGLTWNRGASPERVGDAEVEQARREYVEGQSTIQLAIRYGMSCSAMYDAITGRTWKHVPNPVKEMRSPRHAMQVRLGKARVNSDTAAGVFHAI